MGESGKAGRTARLFEGRFGRLVLIELPARGEVQAQADPAVVLQQGDGDVVFLNPGEIHISLDASRVLVLHAAGSWLRESFPAVLAADEARPFPQPREPITPRIRQLADTLAVEVLNDRFLSPGRLEFMLQELLLSIVETYLAKRRAASPRHYLDMLCVETAISRLASTRRRIAEVAAELGFSAQSNFTRFFLNQVGVPPSKYRRAAAGERGNEPESEPGSNG